MTPARSRRSRTYANKPPQLQSSAAIPNSNSVLYYVCIALTAVYVFLSLSMYSSTSSASTNDEAHHNDITTEATNPNRGNDRILNALTHTPVNGEQSAQACAHTYMQLTDGSIGYLFGILAIHGALMRTQSRYAHNVMLMPNVSQSQIDVLHHLGIGTYPIDGSSMDPYLSDCGNCWTVTFYKMFIFNLTRFQKVLFMDADVGIMHYDGIDELFDHPTPSAVSDRGGNHFELNGGVLLVAPEQRLFEQMLHHVTKVRNAKQLHDEARAKQMEPAFLDNWNSEWRDYCGDQGFLNAFFNSNDTGYGPFYALHYRYGLLTSSFSNEWQRYLLTHRPYILKNVHFTVYKPWHNDGLNRFRQITESIMRAAQRGDKTAYQDEIMARFFVRYWLDVEIALSKCGEFCKRTFPELSIPNDVEKFLKWRPEPFTCYEERIEYIPNKEFANKYANAVCDLD